MPVPVNAPERAPNADLSATSGTDLTRDPGAPVVEVRDLTKVYRLYDKPQDRLKEAFARRFGRHYGRDFYALRGVSFSLWRGEALGIVGRNGAGKSSLLQIIAGTLGQTSGEVTVRGRVAALLELGSGFSPDFTGRENVRLNATIFGFSPAQIDERLDDIVAFADIGEFLDQPVKVYSSGMLVRLAFAVQAHLDPDVLIVDEALSVGDVYFQHRCMRRIRQLLDRGTLLLFVSHSTETVKRFCRRGLWLEQGAVRHFGDAGEVVENYLAFMRMREVQDWRADPLGGTTATVPQEPGDVPGTGSPVAGVLPAPEVLPVVSGEVDLLDERLFQAGEWALVDGGGAGGGRRTSSAAARAGFRCTSSEIVLDFLRGPTSSDADVIVDGAARHLELGSASAGREKVRIGVPLGEHVVSIVARAGRDGSTSLTWAGGRTGLAGALAFRHDPELDRYFGEVERYGTGKARLTAVELLDWATLEPVKEARFGQRVRLRIHAERLADVGPRIEFSYIIRDRNRIDLCGTTSIDEGVRLDPRGHRFVIEFAFDVRLGPGSYSILAAVVECSEDLSLRVPLDQIDIAYLFSVSFDQHRPVWYVFHTPVAARAAVE